MCGVGPLPLLFFFKDTPPTEISSLSLHDALPISARGGRHRRRPRRQPWPNDVAPFRRWLTARLPGPADRKSTRLNSSHMSISYAVFCLKKKKHRPDEAVFI